MVDIGIPHNRNKRTTVAWTDADTGTSLDRLTLTIPRLENRSDLQTLKQLKLFTTGCCVPFQTCLRGVESQVAWMACAHSLVLTGTHNLKKLY